MVSLRRMGTIITQLEAERLGAIDASRGDDTAAADAEDAAMTASEQTPPGPPQGTPPC